MNQVKQCLASQTYATRSCFPVAIRLHDPIDRSVQGIIEIAKEIEDQAIISNIPIFELTMIFVYETV